MAGRWSVGSEDYWKAAAVWQGRLPPGGDVLLEAACA